MKEVPKQEIIQVIDEFLNSNGLWYQFKDFVESKGYTVTELGFKDE